MTREPVSPKRDGAKAGDQRGLVQGTLHMLILKTLALAPMHGYGIARPSAPH